MTEDERLIRAVDPSENDGGDRSTAANVLATVVVVLLLLPVFSAVLGLSWRLFLFAAGA